MIKKNWFKNLPLVLLAAAIALSPSFSAGQIEGGRIIELRVEDFLLVVLGLVWLANFLISGKKKIERPPLFLPILVWLGVGFLSVLTNWIFMNIGFSRGFFYFLKEVEFFFLYFYLFYHIKNINSVKIIIKIWIFLGLVNVGWIICQLLFKESQVLGEFYYYGPDAFIESEGPLPSGGFFLMIFIFLFNIFLYYYLKLNIAKFKKIILGLFTISPVLGVISSGSRASFFGLIFALIITLLFYALKKGFLKAFLIAILCLIFISSIFIFIFSKTLIIERLLDSEGIFWELSTAKSATRASIWQSQLREFLKHPFFIFFGLGKSILLITDESHSQYIRNLIEIGVIGSLVFLILIFAIIKKSWQGFFRKRDPLLIGLSSGLLTATLTMLFISISAEAFIVVKIAEVYWFFAAITSTSLSFKIKGNNIQDF